MVLESADATNVSFTEGTYRVPIALMQETDHTKASAAASFCKKTATLHVDAEGNATMTMSLRPVTVATITDYAQQIAIYPDNSTSSTPVAATENATITTDDNRVVPSEISFAIPDMNMGGVYMRFWVDAMNTNKNAWLSIDYENAVDANTDETYQGTAHVEQFGQYDVDVTVTVVDDKIASLNISGRNFSGTYEQDNKDYLDLAATGLQDAYTGKGIYQDNAEEIYKVDIVSGATYSSKAIRSALMDALDMTYTEEEIKVPTSLKAGVYIIPAMYYTDVACHNLLGGERKEAILTVNDDGSMYLDMNPVSGGDSAPLYLYEFKGYYENNDVNSSLSTDGVYLKAADTDYSDTYFSADTKVINKIVMPLTGGLAKEYATKVRLYVPAMNKLNGDLSGLTFENGNFDVNAFVKLYWNDIEPVSTTVALRDLKDGVYSVNASMVQPNGNTSMSDGAIVKPVMLTKENGKYTLTVNFKGLSIGTQLGYLDHLKYYVSGYTTNSSNYPEGTLADVTVVTKQTYTNGRQISDSYGSDYPDVVSFEMIDEAVDNSKVPLQVYVPVMESISTGSGTQNVYMVLDPDSVKATTASDAAFKDTTTVYDPQTPAATLKFAKSTMTVSYGAKAFTNALTKVTDGKVTFSTSNSSVAVVDANGKVTVKGAGKAVITVSSAQTLSYKAGKASYTLIVNPGKAVIASVKNSAKKTMQITWKKGVGIGNTTAKAKYYVQYALAKNFKGVKTVTIAGTKTAAVIKSLKKGKTYYVRVRAYDTVTKKYGAYSAVKSIKIKK